MMLDSVEALRQLVEEWGYLPLFAGTIPGFSVQELTPPGAMFGEEPSRDPWVWRELLAEEGQIAYGKFFDKKAGFISKAMLPSFCNLRRDGYDFDARWDDELASYRHKRIMDLFVDEEELPSYLLRQRAGFGKDGDKGFEGAITALQMQTYLCVRRFERRRNRRGEPYGWSVSVLSTPETVFGSAYITSGYAEPPQETRTRLIDHCRHLTGATERQAGLLIG